MNSYLSNVDTLHEDLAAERPRIVRLCALLTGNSDAAEDLAQEVLIEAWRHHGALRDPQALRAWLSGIARNVCARWHRANGRDQARRAPLPELPEQQLADPFDFEVELERHELATLLDRALALLPEATRSVLVEKYVRESPHAAIAEQLGMSENAVTVRLHRGRLALRGLLEGQLRGEAASFGLAPEQGEGWRETMIWCTNCGQHRLRGIFNEQQFILRCPRCNIEPDSFHSQSSATTHLSGVTRFRPALTRFSRWMHGFFQQAIAEGTVGCTRCGAPQPLHLRLPDYAPPSIRAQRGMHILCARCGAGSYESLAGLVLNTPAAHQFWRAHPRMRTLPERELSYQGLPALLTTFESIDRQARLEAIIRRDSYAIIAISEAANAE